MRKILQFLKGNAVSLLSAVLAGGFIAVAVMGMTSDAMTSKMNAKLQETGASAISQLKSDPKNAAVIEKEKQRGDMFKAEYVKTVEKAQRINKREPLMGQVFPKAGSTTDKFRFREKYKNEAIKSLRNQLDAGTLPTELEVAEEVENVEDLIQLDMEREAEELADPRAPAAAAPPVARTGGPRSEAGALRAPGESGALRPGAYPPSAMMGRQMGQSSVSAALDKYKHSDEPKYNPLYRARVSKALSILCYVDEATFHVSPIAFDTAEPTPMQLWFAQVGLWIQQDVASAVAALNKEAADRVTDGDPSVQDVPVKRIDWIRVQGYLTKDGAMVPFEDAMSRSGPQAESGEAFTRRVSNEQYDLVRFALSAVVDQRKVLDVVDAISRVNFFQCIDIDYQAVDRLSEQEGDGYFYGTDPVVRVTMAFEAYLLRDVYDEKMPPEVRKYLDGAEE